VPNFSNAGRWFRKKCRKHLTFDTEWYEIKLWVQLIRMFKWYATEQSSNTYERRVQWKLTTTWLNHSILCISSKWSKEVRNFHHLAQTLSDSYFALFGPKKKCQLRILQKNLLLALVCKNLMPAHFYSVVSTLLFTRYQISFPKVQWHNHIHPSVRVCKKNSV